MKLETVEENQIFRFDPGCKKLDFLNKGGIEFCKKKINPLQNQNC